MDQGETRDASADMHELTFRIIARALFSTAMDENEIHRLSEQITELQAFIIDRIRRPFLQWWYNLSGQMKVADRKAAEIRGTLLRIIQSRTAEGDGPRRNDLLDMLLDTRYEDTGEPMSEQQLLDEVLILFVAGHETSANALAWALYLLGQHPEYQEGIKAEAGRPVNSLKDVMGKSFTRQVIEETMRLYPPAWMIDRVALNDDQSGDLSWPAETFFLLYVYGMHRSAHLWPDANDFRPERFSDEARASHVPYAYLPFGAGPRLCIGNQFAMTEMILVLSYIFSNYDYKLLTEQISLRPLITLRPDRSISLLLA